MKAIAIINKMPNDCDECPFVNENRYCILLNEDAFPNDWVEDAPYYSLKEKGDCPLRPLPKGHGRLIDADAFIRFIKDVSGKAEIRRGADRQKYDRRRCAECRCRVS